MKNKLTINEDFKGGVLFASHSILGEIMFMRKQSKNKEYGEMFNDKYIVDYLIKYLKGQKKEVKLKK